jgi:hypothetical protein
MEEVEKIGRKEGRKEVSFELLTLKSLRLECDNRNLIQLPTKKNKLSALGMRVGSTRGGSQEACKIRQN